MAVETSASRATASLAANPAKNSPADNMVAIDAPLGKPACSTSKSRLRDAEEDLACLQEQLIEVLEENNQLRAELEAWRMRAMALPQQNKAS